MISSRVYKVQKLYLRIKAGITVAFHNGHDRRAMTDEAPRSQGVSKISKKVSAMSSKANLSPYVMGQETLTFYFLGS